MMVTERENIKETDHLCSVCGKPGYAQTDSRRACIRLLLR